MSDWKKLYAVIGVLVERLGVCSCGLLLPAAISIFLKCADVPYLNCSTVSPSTVTAPNWVCYVSLVSGQSMGLRNLVEHLVLVCFCFFYAEIVTCWSKQLYGCPSGKVVKQSAFIYSIRRSQSVCQITSLGVHCVWCKSVCWKRHRALLCCIFLQVVEWAVPELYLVKIFRNVLWA